jgi:8-amino-7-oxononanoate synthase
MNLHERIRKSIQKRKSEGLYRQLINVKIGIDFYSNDYLGYSRLIPEIKRSRNFFVSAGSTGSRLISGNYSEIIQLEKRIAELHQSEECLLFSSGYLANFALLSTLPSRHDLILFDEYCHASLMDGIHFSRARHFSFKHNRVDKLFELLQKHHSHFENIFVVTESLFSMDGDYCPLKEFIERLSYFSNVYLILDEAHALGTSCSLPFGLSSGIENKDKIVARIYTYGKALGCAGASVCTSADVKEYLINFSRPFIYTTAPAPELAMSVNLGYDLLSEKRNISELMNTINFFKSEFRGMDRVKVQEGPIQVLMCENNASIVGDLINQFSENEILCKYIKYPTVPLGMERFRITLHSYNTEEEIKKIKECLSAIS